MDTPTTPVNDGARVAALRRLGLLDTPPEERFDRYTRLARRLFGVQIALVSLVDDSRQWFKSRQGLDAAQTPRDISFCGHAVADDELLIVPDALADTRFSDNPLVLSDPSIRFYAGCPVRTADGHPIGTICLIDRAPRAMSADDVGLLRDLAAMVEQEFTARRVATTDDLTGLSNRLGFRTVGSHALAMCLRIGLPATMLSFDLDGFKRINDRLGHAEGDRALRIFANALATTFREADVVGRVGGDEFVVLCTGADTSAVDPLLTRLAAELDTLSRAAALSYEIRYSAGSVAYDAAGCSDIDALLAAADQRMYDQKKQAAGGEARAVVANVRGASA